MNTIIVNIITVLAFALMGWQLYGLGRIVERGRLMDRIIAKRKALTDARGWDIPVAEFHLHTLSAFEDAMEGRPMPPKS
jgi:uncharacterized alpha-E superfamily protein